MMPAKKSYARVHPRFQDHDGPRGGATGCEALWIGEQTTQRASVRIAARGPHLSAARGQRLASLAGAATAGGGGGGAPGGR